MELVLNLKITYITTISNRFVHKHLSTVDPLKDLTFLLSRNNKPTSCILVALIKI